MYKIESFSTSMKLMRDMFNVKKGETVVITCDTESSYDVVESTAQAAFSLGAKPMIVKIAAPLGVGKSADPDLPQEALTELLCQADVWVEYNNKWIFYSTVFDNVIRRNKKIRYMCLVGANTDLLLRNIGRVDIPLLREFLVKVADLTYNAKHMRVTTPAGTDIEFDNVPGRKIDVADGYVNLGEVKMMIGQIGWSPEFKSINGTIVFDGTLTPPLKKLAEPIKLTVKESNVLKIEGGTEAKEFENWLKSFNDPQMFKIAHICYGFNPGAKLTGDIVEDERVWGCTEWGLGNVGAHLVSDIPGGIPGASHTDGICLNSSVWLDGKPILIDGQVVGPTEEIVELSRMLKK